MLLLILLGIGVIAGVYLVQTKTNILPKAGGPAPTIPTTSFILSPNKPIVMTGDEIKVTVLVRTDIATANLFTAKLKFPADLLQVKELHTDSNLNTAGSSQVKGVSIAQAITCNYNQVALHATPQTINIGQPVNFTISGDASTWIVDDFGSGVTNCTGGWNNKTCQANRTGDYTWTHTWKHCQVDFNHCSNTCTLQTNYSVKDNTPHPTSTPVVTPAPTVAPTPPLTPNPTPTLAPTPFPLPTVAPSPSNLPDYFIKNWVERSFDNTAGTISLTGGVPNPGYQTTTSPGIMADIIFVAKKEGTATLSFADTSAIYSNEDNINILTGKEPINLSIVSETISPSPSPYMTCASYPDGPKCPSGYTCQFDSNSLPGASGKCVPSPTSIPTGKASLSLDPAGGVFNKGCNASLNVNVDTGGAQTEGTDAVLLYNPSKLTATSINKGSIYLSYPRTDIDSQNGKITISGISSLQTTFAGKGTLATINFAVPATAVPGATEVSFDFDPNNKTRSDDSNIVQSSTLVDILDSARSGMYSVGNGESCQTVSPTPVSTCTLTSASWSPLSTTKGSKARLNVTGSSCANQQVAFKVVRNGLSINDGNDVTIQPAPITLNSSGNGTGTWVAEYNPLISLLPLPGTNPQYYFVASVSNGSFVNTQDNLLTVTPAISPSPPQSSPTPVPTGIVPTPAPGAGDGNGNGKLDLIDLSVLLSDFNKNQGFRAAIDMNGDGVINAFDFSLLRTLLIQKGIIKGS